MGWSFAIIGEIDLKKDTPVEVIADILETLEAPDMKLYLSSREYYSSFDSGVALIYGEEVMTLYLEYIVTSGHVNKEAFENLKKYQKYFNSCYIDYYPLESSTYKAVYDPKNKEEEFVVREG